MTRRLQRQTGPRRSTRWWHCFAAGSLDSRELWRGYPPSYCPRVNSLLSVVCEPSPPVKYSKQRGCFQNIVNKRVSLGFGPRLGFFSTVLSIANWRELTCQLYFL